MKKDGFTLIELMVAILIIGIITSMAVPRLAGRVTAAKKHAAKSDIQGALAIALSLFEMDMGRYPLTTDGLESLVEEPRGMAGMWNGPYLAQGVVPDDPWGNPYRYEYPAVRSKGDYDLYSPGPDGMYGTEDDIGNWKSDAGAS